MSEIVGLSGNLKFTEIFRFLDERKNALCLSLFPFPHCLVVIESLEFGENFSKNRRSLHCILFPSFLRSYCELSPRGLIGCSDPSKSSFRCIPLHFGELYCQHFENIWSCVCWKRNPQLYFKVYFFVTSFYFSRQVGACK